MSMEEFAFPRPVSSTATERRELEPKDKVEKDFVLPLLEDQVPFEEMFPREVLQAQMESCDAYKVVDASLNDRLPVGYRRLEIGESQAKQLLEQDLIERAITRFELVGTSALKIHFAELVAKAVAVEQERFSDRRIPGISDALLSVLQTDIQNLVQALNGLAVKSLEFDVDPEKDSRAIQGLKTEYVYYASSFAATAVALERVSPTSGQTGPVQNLLSEKTRVVADRAPGTYVRTHAGTYAHLLGFNIAHEYGLPGDTQTSKYAIECFSSGMAALTTVMDRISGPDSETVMTSGFYFEIPEYALKNGIVKETTDVDENFYTGFARRLRDDIQKPIVYYAQPFSSGMDEEPFDMDRFLKVIEDTDYERPLTLVIDSTMHGATLDLWDRIDKITSSKKNFTLIRIESLVKHAQLGTDKVPGGVALAYGTSPNLIRGLTAARGTMLPEFNAAYLLPFSGEIQSGRIARASRNAEFMAQYLGKELADNPLIDGVYYSAGKDTSKVAEQYNVTPPFLFIKVTNAVADFFPSWLSNDIAGHLSGRSPAGGHGASYGFDGTRVDQVVVKETGETYLRIAAGQESSLQLLGLTHMLEQIMNDPKWRDSIGQRLKSEFRSITNPIEYSKDSLHYSIFFNPEYDPRNAADQYIQDVGDRPIVTFFQDQAKARMYIDQFSRNPKLCEALDIGRDTITSLRDSLSSPKEIEKLFNEWAITQPGLLDTARSKLPMGKNLSKEVMYLLAKQCISSRVARAALLPIAKIVEKTLKQTKREFEQIHKLKLPF
jgi:hypothetical protein